MVNEDSKKASRLQNAALQIDRTRVELALYTL